MKTDNTLSRIIRNIHISNLSEYDQWELQLIRLIEDKFDVGTSDAQGIVEANNFVISQCWGKNLTPIESIKLI